MTEQDPEVPVAEAKPEPLHLDTPLYDYVQHGANSQAQQERPDADGDEGR